MRKAIGKAKKKAWDELLDGLSGDPWGRPYKMIMNKINPDSVNIAEKLTKNVMEGIVNLLFPKDRGVNVYKDDRYETRENIPAINSEEMDKIIQRAIKKGSKAPGPDGIQARLYRWPKQTITQVEYTGGCTMAASKQGYFRIDGRLQNWYC